MTAWLLDTLLYTGLLIALVLVLRRPVGKWFGPNLAYTLWALPFLRLLLPPIVLPASLAPAPELAPVSLPAAASYQVAEAAPVAAIALEHAATPAPVGPAWDWSDLTAVLLSVWLGGALAFLAWRILTYRRMRRELLAGARTVGEIGKVRLVETPALAAPVAFGVYDKVIGLPPLFMAQPDIVARDLAIAHELAHHRGHDLLANFAAQALLALHWFNPLAWYGWRAMRRDQEAACDARVVAGRGREERALYAALIADIAAGPRLALAAPMACPVLGDKSIIHRLKSLSMSDASPRRRLLGRGLVGAAALALPLTASISYASAQAPEVPVPPVAVDPTVAVDAPLPPEAPAAPAAVTESDQPRVFAVRRVGEGGKHEVRDFTLYRDPDAPMPPMPGAPRVGFHGQGAGWDSEEFEARMEAWGREMEKWGKEYGEQWGRHYSRQAQQQAAEARAEALAEAAEARAEAQAEAGEARAEAAQARAQALARAEVARSAPRVVRDCTGDQRGGPRVENGRQVVVICEQRTNAMARASLRQARSSIAGNRDLSPAIRDEILADLDSEIARIESED